MSRDNGYVSSDYLREMARKMRAFKQLSFEHMDIASGDTVLDVGCGPGVDTIPLAELVGPSGKVIGIDNDPAMLEEAESAVTEHRTVIEHRHGSADALPLDDGSINACRAERLLQVLPPSMERPVVTELVRVTQPGGRVVLIDADWTSATVDFSDAQLERKLMQFFTLQMRPNGLSGRRLYGLCGEAGLTDLRIDVVPMVQQRYSDTPFGDWLINTAIKDGVMDQSEADMWRTELEQKEAEQRFYASVNMVIVSGRK